MAFTIYHSNHLDSLQYMASYLIKGDPLENSLAPEYFIIHSSGMTNWLKSALAHEHGIFANTRLEFPINQIVTIIENLLTDEEKAITNLRISRLTLTWAVYDILVNSPLDELSILEAYLKIETVQHQDVRAMGLAEEIAGLFDKYLAYRPNWFSAWQNNELVFPDSADELWQQKIWQKICEKVMPQYYLGNIVELLKKISSERYQHPNIPKRMFVIGISTLPPLFIELLHLLSEHIDIHLFFTNPSQFYWGDLTQYRSRKPKRIVFESRENRDDLLSPNFQEDEHWLEFHGNPLLASFGKIGRDFLYLFSQYDDIKEIEAFSEPITKGLLGYIQRAVFNLAPVAVNEEKYLLGSDDQSIVFHSHYSERREVEGLYDQLLHAFNQNPELLPKDIIVMVSDIDRYRPMIEAVFGSPLSQEAKIPFTISDFTLGKHEPILEAFLMLLSISESQFAVSEILLLLDIPEIGEKFNLSLDDRGLIKQWIEHTNIRFGINNEHLTELNIRDDFTNTWLWGLKRLLLGYGFNDAVTVDGVNVFPYIQGGDAITLGHFVDFVDVLIDLREKLSHTYPLAEWRTILADIWRTFYSDNEETQYRLQHLQSIWNGFIDEGLATQFSEDISIHLMHRHLHEHLSSFRPEANFLTGSVNFCTFVPMRSIPFKIVCMLGMNQDSFPNRRQYPEYDLMQAHPARGDRSGVNDERYLFLEAILSAQEKLYISYIGKNIQNSSEMFPSLFVNELQHYLEEIASINGGDNQQSVTQTLTIQHPLSPFSPLLFTEGSTIQSFQKAWLPATENINTDKFVPKAKAVKNISVKALIDSYKDPLKSFSLHHFGISFYSYSDKEIEDDELFSLSEQGSLMAYQARLRLIEELFYTDVSDDLLHDYARNILFQRYKAEGRLPKFAFAKLDWLNFVAPILQMVLMAKGKNCQYGKLQQLSIETNNIVIEGTIVGTDSSEQCLLFAGQWNLRRQFEAYITHLLHTVRLSQPVTTSVLLCDGKKVSEVEIAPLEIDAAHVELSRFLEGYFENFSSPFLLIADETKVRLTKDVPLIKKHQKFIEGSYRNYDAEKVTMYLSEHQDFNTEVFSRISDFLENVRSDSIINERFFEKITSREVINYLYFYLRYIDPVRQLKAKEIKFDS